MVSPLRHALKSIWVVTGLQLRQWVREMGYILSQFAYAHHATNKHLNWQTEPVHYNRQALLNVLVQTRPACRFLEIGCDFNQVFDAIPLPMSQKIGVDPERGGTHRMTSDAFFERYPNERFDVVFIDGLHHYEQVRRDVMNAMAALNPGGWIVLHDMLPLNWAEAHTPRISNSWAGDCWKVAFELLETPGIDFRLVKADCGMAVVRITDERTACLADRRALLLYAPYAYLCDHVESLPLVDWADLMAWSTSVTCEPGVLAYR